MSEVRSVSNLVSSVEKSAPLMTWKSVILPCTTSFLFLRSFKVLASMLSRSELALICARTACVSSTSPFRSVPCSLADSSSSLPLFLAIHPFLNALAWPTLPT